MNRRLVISAVALAAVGGAVAPSFAATSSPISSPVGVSVRTDNGVFVGTTILGQPGLAASVSNGQACVGFSLEVPQCVSTVQSGSTQSLPVSVQQDSTGTTVIVGRVGVHVSNDGEVCPLVSTQSWQCIGGTGLARLTLTR